MEDVSLLRIQSFVQHQLGVMRNCKTATQEHRDSESSPHSQAMFHILLTTRDGLDGFLSWQTARFRMGLGLESDCCRSKEGYIDS